MPHSTCSMPDCESPVKSKGKCNKHYSADYRAANPDVARRAAEKWRIANREKANAASRASKAKQQEKRKQYGRDYYQKNKDEIRAKQVAYYAENRDMVLARAAQARKANPDLRRLSSMRWARANAEYLKAKGERYRTVNPDVGKRSEAKRRALKRGRDAFSVTSRDIRRLEIRFEGRCAYCKSTLAPGYHLDHVVPLSRGGAHSIGNLVPACQPCNNRKAASTIVEWKRRQLLELSL